MTQDEFTPYPTLMDKHLLYGSLPGCHLVSKRYVAVMAKANKYFWHFATDVFLSDNFEVGKRPLVVFKPTLKPGVSTHWCEADRRGTTLCSAGSEHLGTLADRSCTTSARLTKRSSIQKQRDLKVENNSNTQRHFSKAQKSFDCTSAKTKKMGESSTENAPDKPICKCFCASGFTPVTKKDSCVRRGRRKTCTESFRSSTTNRRDILHFFFVTVLLLGFHLPSSSAIPIRWDLGPFSECSVTCGRGTQNRSVVCREKPEGFNRSSSTPHVLHYLPKGRRMPDLMCPAPKPVEIQACSQTSCRPEWTFGAWAKCSRKCHRGLQRRTAMCLQKLGNGRTVRVHPEYCSHSIPITRRLCYNRKGCGKWLVTNWSTCQSSCGAGMQTRSVSCFQVYGKKKRLRLKDSKCSKQLKPARVRKCKARDCANSLSSPVIATSNVEFVQDRPLTKVRLQVGQRASVYPGTTIVIKCRVTNFQPGNIRWRCQGQTIERSVPTSGSPRAKLHVGVLADGSLRIVRARPSDSGRCTCFAGPISASSDIDISPHEEESRDLTQLLPDAFDVDLEMFDQSERDSANSYVGVRRPSNIQAAGPPLPPIRRNADRFRSPIISKLEPVPRVVHPRISRVAAPPVLQVESRSHQVHSLSVGRNYGRSGPQMISRLDPSLEREVLEDLNPKSPQQSSLEAFRAHYNQLDETAKLFEKGLITELQRDERDSRILNEIDRLTSGNDERISARSGFDFSGVNRRNRFPEERFQPASIIPQTTSTPLQLDRDVTAYVGGHLMVADAERVTILCEATGNPAPVVAWYRNGKKLPEHDRQFVLMEGSLRLLYPQLSDAGNYMCFASNSHGNDSKTTDLSVMQKPIILSTTSTVEDFTSDVLEAAVGSDVRAKLGAKITIRCPVEGYPDPFVVWRKDASGLGQNTKVLADNSLEIYPATAADQGLFGCEASNPAGSDYQASSLVLIDPPHLLEHGFPDVDGALGLPELLATGLHTERYDVKTNSTVMMGCPVGGFPDPEVTWLFNDLPLDEQPSAFDYQLMKRGKVLELTKASSPTEGTYTCVAHNDGGNLTTRLRLNLITYSFALGNMTPCSASCGRNGLQFPTVLCLRDDVTEVDEWYCTGLQRPEVDMTPCNRVDCPPTFTPGVWSACSASCGNGTRVRAPSCVVLMSDGSTREVAKESCAGHESRPTETKPCFERQCPEWRTGPWRSCSRKCFSRGTSLKSRRVFCVGSKGKRVRRRHCPAESKPRRKARCRNLRCRPVWVTSRWSNCSHPCGPHGFKTRIVNCVYRGRKKQPAGNRCSSRRMPAIKLRCNRRRCGSHRRRKPKRSNVHSCADLFSGCSRVKELGLCRIHSRVCCQSCRKVT